jgi:RimJ/RimL family protein N-acetyltransferase
VAPVHPVTLRTERLTLSPPTVDDIDARYEACQDPEIPRYTTVPSPYTRQHAADFVRRVSEQWRAGSHLTWSVRREGRLVGSVGIYRLDGLGAGELG